MDELIPIPYHDDYLFDIATWQIESLATWLNDDYDGLYYQEVNGNLIHDFIDSHNLTPFIGHKYYFLSICWFGGCHYIHLANIEQPMEIMELSTEYTMVLDDYGRLRNLPSISKDLAHRTMIFSDEDDKNKIIMFFKLHFGDWNIKEDLI